MCKETVKRYFFNSKRFRLFFKFVKKLYIKFKYNVLLKYGVFLIIVLVIVFIFLAPSEVVTINNETMFSTCVGWKFKDHSSLVATIIGVFTFFATICGVNMNYKSSKLSFSHNNAVDLLIDLEYWFNKYEIDKKNNNCDVISFFIDILRKWKNHQKAFRLLSPNFYKNFHKLYIKTMEINGTDSSVINSQYIIKAIIVQLSDNAMISNQRKFYFIKPDLIADGGVCIDKFKFFEDDYDYFDLNKNGLESYISKLNGVKTKKLTHDAFSRLCNDLDDLLDELKEEMNNYELL